MTPISIKRRVKTQLLRIAVDCVHQGLLFKLVAILRRLHFTTYLGVKSANYNIARLISTRERFVAVYEYSRAI